MDWFEISIQTGFEPIINPLNKGGIVFSEPFKCFAKTFVVCFAVLLCDKRIFLYLGSNSSLA